MRVFRGIIGYVNGEKYKTLLELHIFIESHVFISHTICNTFLYFQ